MLIISIIFLKAINIIVTWYLSGLYLICLGLHLLIENGDVFIGFLWVVDLGVGLIFFIFILHFSNFLYQKTIIDLYNKITLNSFLYGGLVLIFFFFFFSPTAQINNVTKKAVWFYYISWYNYYELLKLNVFTNLQILREMYFYLNSWEFFIINFMLFYGIVASIILTFMLKKMFNTQLLAQLQIPNLIHKAETNFFIRQQNFNKQQNTSTGTRVWLKKTLNKNDF